MLLCDEGTSCVDIETDAQVHRVLFSLEGTTVLEICHRLHHIERFDKVIVLAEGKVVETGTPAGLIADPSSVLSEMMKNTHLR